MKQITKQQWLLFVVATLMWISVKSGQFLMRTQASLITSDAKMIASIVGISGLVGFIIRFPLGVFSDYIKRKTLIIKVSLACMILTGTLYLLNKEAIYLYVYNLSMGITISTWVLFNVLFSKEASSGKVIASVGLLAISNNIGSYIAPLMTGMLVKSSMVDGKIVYDFSMNYHIWFALVTGIFALIFSFMLKDGQYQSTERPTLRKTMDFINDKKLWILSLIGFVVTFMKYATLKFSFETVVKSLNGTAMAIGNIDANYDLLHAIAGVIAGVYLIHKIGKTKTMILGVMIMSGSMVLSYLSTSLNMFLMMNLIAGFGMGLTYITAMGMVIEGVPYEYKNTRMGFFQSIYMFGIYIAPKITIFIESHIDKKGIYLFSSFLGLLTILIMIVTYKALEGKLKNE